MRARTRRTTAGLRRLTACCVTAAVVAASVGGGGAVAAETAVTAALTGFAPAVDVNAMTAQFHSLERIAGRYPDGAGGTYFDEKTGQLVVRRVQNSAGAAFASEVGRLPRLAGTVSVRFETTAVPMSRLEAANELLGRSSAWAGANSGKVRAVWLDSLTPQVVIEATGDADALRQAAAAATGITPQVTVSNSGVVSSSRREDAEPYFGGLALYNGDLALQGDDPHDLENVEAECTTGFRMTRGGTDSNWVTTAGHCTEFYNVFWHNGGWNLRVRHNYLPSGTDVAMLSGENGKYFSRKSWFGGPDTEDFRGVTGKNTSWPAVGSAVYMSGANGGLIYGVVRGINQRLGTGCAGNSPVVVVDTITGHPSDGYVRHGDSGGPVTRWNTSTADTTDLAAVGIISCTGYPDSDPDVASTAAFTPIFRVEAATGAVVVVAGT